MKRLASMGGKPTKIEPPSLDKKSLEKLQTMVQGKFSEEEIQTWYQAYKNSRHSDNGQLTKEEFKQVYNKLFRGDATEFAEHVFRTFDLNNDGRVDFSEFLLGLCVTGNSDIESKITWAFKVYDIDGDGTISWKEMKNIVQSVCNMSPDSVINELEQELVRQADLLGNSSHVPLHEEGLFTGGVHENPDKAGELADKIFQILDQNGDGLISLEEFVEGALKIPVVINLLERHPDD